MKTENPKNSDKPICPECKKSEFSKFRGFLICDSNICNGLIYYDISILYQTARKEVNQET